MSVERRVLGSTGIPVSPIGLGLAAIGRPAYITTGREEDIGSGRSVEQLRTRTHAILDAAVARGVRYLDAARSYGLAESFLASWLAARPDVADEVSIGSKWGYRYVADWRVDAQVQEVKDHSLSTLREQLAESRALLGSRLRLYQIHSATLESGVLEDRAVLAELLALREEGLAIGLTVSGPRQAEVIRAALAVSVDGRNPFQTVQATWNLLEPSADSALAEAHDAGWGVIVKESLANGLLARSGEGLEPVEAVARAHGATLDAVAIAAALDQPWADVVLSGAATVQQLESNVAAVDIRLDTAEIAELLTLAEEPERYWRLRSERPWV